MTLASALPVERAGGLAGHSGMPGQPRGHLGDERTVAERLRLGDFHRSQKILGKVRRGALVGRLRDESLLSPKPSLALCHVPIGEGELLDLMLRVRHDARVFSAAVLRPALPIPGMSPAGVRRLRCTAPC